MSLINDSLKEVKQQKNSENENGSTDEQSAGEEPSETELHQWPPRGDSEGPPWLKIFVLTGVVGILILAAAFTGYFLVAEPSQTESEGTETVAAAEQQKAPNEPGKKTPASAAEENADSNETAEREPNEKETTETKKATDSSAEQTADKTSGDSGKSEEAKTKGQATSDGNQRGDDATWDEFNDTENRKKQKEKGLTQSELRERFQITGILRSDSERVAIINGSVVKTNDTIDDAKVEKVKPKSVVLVIDGDSYTLGTK